MDVRATSCERSTTFVSLELDGELSLFERALLRRHLQRCGECAAYARQVTAVTEMVRAAPLEPIRVRNVWQSRRRVSRVVQGVGATAAVAALAIWLGVGAVGTTREHAPFNTGSSPSKAVATSDGRYDWPAGLPRTVQAVQQVPGGLYTVGVGS
jgi:ferric-dicitrate binding protein FerR (iron transport regulator)